MSDLIPCPFDGGQPAMRETDERDFFVECESCYVRTDLYIQPECAAEAWNLRAPADPALLALDRELRIRNLLASRAANTAAANREIAQFGEWRRDHDAFDLECADAVRSLLAPDGAQSEATP